MGFLAAFALKLPVMWVYFLLCTDEFAKWPWVIRHYRSGKWLNNITRDVTFHGMGFFSWQMDVVPVRTRFRLRKNVGT